MSANDILDSSIEWADDKLKLRGMGLSEDQKDYLRFSIRNRMIQETPACESFTVDTESGSSATKCYVCGQEKYKHFKGGTQE